MTNRPQFICESGAVRSRWWYAVGAAVATLGWVIAVAFTAGVWDELRESEITPVGQPFDASGRTVAVLTDLPQPGRDVTCEAVGPKKKRTAIADQGVIDVTVTTDGTRWHLIALMPSGRDQMNVRCKPGDELSDSAGYGYAVIDDLDARDASGRFIAWGSGVIGLAIAGVTAWRRRSAPAVASSGQASADH